MIWKQFISRVHQNPDRPAVHVRDQTISYQELAGLAGALAQRHLTGPSGKPRRALIQQTDPFAILLCLLACWHSRVVPIVMRENASRAQLDELTALLRPEHLLLTPIPTEQLTPLSSNADNFAPWTPRDEALVLNTSGTTGNPKLVALPAESVCLNAATIGACLEMTSEDRIAVTTPLTYMYGLMGATVAGLWAGAAVHFFSPQTPLPIVQAHIRKNHITVVQGPPTLMRLFITYWNGHPFPSVRMVTTGGEALSPELAADLNRAFTEAKKIFIYGMTEAGPRISHDDINTGGFARGCVGKPYQHIEWRIDPLANPDLPAHVGRLALRGPSIFLGYLQPDGNYAGLEADGFFCSNDLVSRDEAGRLYFHGRLDRMFKSGGKLVNPNTIERILIQHHGVQQARCRVEPHPILGFVPVADVVAKTGHQPTEADLKTHCEYHLDSHAVPRKFHRLAQLPINHSGKA